MVAGKILWHQKLSKLAIPSDGFLLSAGQKQPKTKHFLMREWTFYYVHGATYNLLGAFERWVIHCFEWNTRNW